MIKGKDFKKAVAFIKEFLLKLPEDVECAELRDSLNLSLLHMKKYFKTVWLQTHEKDESLLSSSLPRGMSPVTPYQDVPDRFHWKWVNVNNCKSLRASLPVDGQEIPSLSLILQASKEGDHELIQHLLHKEPSSAQQVDVFGRTSLMYAVHFGHIDCLSKLLNCKIDVNYQAHDGSTIMHSAVHSGNHIALEMLLQYGANTNIQDSQGRAPLHWAAVIPGTQCLELLLKCKDICVNIRDLERLTPTMWACHMDNKNHFELLIASDNNIIEESDGIERDTAGQTWIHWAVRKEPPLLCLQSLLSPETSAIKDAEGKTVIHTASETGAFEACRIIIDKGGDSCLNSVDFQNRTCLHLAAISAHSEVLNFLLEEGADLYRKDKFNATAWDYASNKDLHYCKLIIQSFEKQYKRREKKSEHNSEEPREGNNNFAMMLSRNRSVSPSPPLRPRRNVHIVPVPKTTSQSRGAAPVHSHKEYQVSQVKDVGEDEDGLDESSTHGKYNCREEIDDKLQDMEKYAENQVPNKEIRESRDDAIISSDMQPSVQTMEGLDQTYEESAFEEHCEGSISQVKLASISSDLSEQSINIGMNISDCDDEGNDNLESTVGVPHEEPFPVTLTTQHSKSSTATSCHPVNQHPPRPGSPAPLNALQSPFSIPLVQSQLSSNILAPQPLITSSSMHLVPLANIGKESSKEVPKIKKKKKKGNRGDRGGQPIVGVQSPQGPPRTTNRGYPLQPPNAPHSSLNGKHNKGYPVSSRFSQSHGSQLIP